MRLSDVAAEFRYLWAKSKTATRVIVEQYKRARKESERDWRLFDLCVDMYGYIMLTLQMHWVLFEKEEGFNERYLEYAVLLRNGESEWRKCVDAIVTHLKSK